VAGRTAAPARAEGTSCIKRMTIWPPLEKPTAYTRDQVTVEALHQEIDRSLGKGDVVDVVATRGRRVDDPGIVPVPLVAVQVGNDRPGLGPDVVEGVRGERANCLRGLHRAVKDQHYRYRGRPAVANDRHGAGPATDPYRLLCTATSDMVLTEPL
jgi:hypothetical protein